MVGRPKEKFYFDECNYFSCGNGRFGETDGGKEQVAANDPIDFLILRKAAKDIDAKS